MKGKPKPLVIAALSVAHISVTAWTWRDIRSRPADQIRGNKRFWQVVSAANMGNAAVYWLVGRRRRAATPTTGNDQAG